MPERITASDPDCPYEYEFDGGTWYRIDEDGTMEEASITIECLDDEVTLSPPDNVMTMPQAVAWAEKTWPEGDYGQDGIHVIDVCIRLWDTTAPEDRWLIDERTIGVQVGSLGDDDDECIDGHYHDWEEVEDSARMHGGRCYSYVEQCSTCGARRRVYSDPDARYTGPIEWAEEEPDDWEIDVNGETIEVEGKVDDAADAVQWALRNYHLTIGELVPGESIRVRRNGITVATYTVADPEDDVADESECGAWDEHRWDQQRYGYYVCEECGAEAHVALDTYADEISIRITQPAR